MTPCKSKSAIKSTVRQEGRSPAVSYDRRWLTNCQQASRRAAWISGLSDGGTRRGWTPHFAAGVPALKVKPGRPSGTPSAGGWTRLAIRRWRLVRFGRIKEIASRSDRALLDFDFRRVPRLGPMWAVCRIVGLRPRSIRTDRTRRGWHVIVELNERLQAAELVALQAVLGSDNRRECLNLMRVIGMRKHPVSPFWRRRWNLLFERKIN